MSETAGIFSVPELLCRWGRRRSRGCNGRRRRWRGASRRRRCGLLRRGGSLRLGAGIDPACMNASTQRFRLLGVDGAKAHEAPECRLNMAAGAAEAIIEIEVAERGV